MLLLSDSGSEWSADSDRDVELAEGECRVLGSICFIDSSGSCVDLCCDFMVFVIRSSLKGLLLCLSFGGCVMGLLYSCTVRCMAVVISSRLV